MELETVAPAGRWDRTSLAGGRRGWATPRRCSLPGRPARAALPAQIAANDAGQPEDAVPPTIHDPDTAFLRIRVLVRPPKFDPLADEAGFVQWYVTTRRFPADPTQPLTVSVTWVDAADYREIDVSAQAGRRGQVSARCRLPPRAMCGWRYGRSAATTWPTSPGSERGPRPCGHHRLPRGRHGRGRGRILRPLPPSDRLRSVFLRPDPVGAKAEAHAVVAQNAPSPILLGRLAAALDLVADGPMLLGQAWASASFSVPRG